MKILWVGDAVCSSGFAKCTHVACNELSKHGYDVSVLGLNYFGDPHSYTYPIYPCQNPLDYGRDAFGLTRLPHLGNRLDPDVIVILNDPWNIPNYLQSIKEMPDCKPRVVAWLAVDSKNQIGAPLNDLDHVIVWTQFGIDELRSGGYRGSASIVPLGVDLGTYRLKDKQESKTKAVPKEIRDNSFIVGVVGRNQPRKRLDLTLEYFATWIKSYSVDNAFLYLHVAPTGETGFNVRSLIAYYGLQGKVMLSEPGKGAGITEDDLATLYSTFDVYLSTSQGEGWGLTILEAMACGVPCIVGDWAGLGEWVEDAALKIPCFATVTTAPMNAQMHTLGGIPDRALTVEALDKMYTESSVRDTYSERGLALAKRYPWSNVGELFHVELLAAMGDDAAKVMLESDAGTFDRAVG